MNDDALQEYQRALESENESETPHSETSSVTPPSLEDESIATFSRTATHDGQAIRGRGKNYHPRQELSSKAYNAALLWGISTLILAVAFLVIVNWIVVGDNSTFPATVLDSYKQDHRIDGMPWITIMMWIIAITGFSLGAHSILGRLFSKSTQLVALWLLIFICVGVLAEVRYGLWPGAWRHYVSNRLKPLPASEVPERLKVILGL
jgi:hypothetical protein